MARQPQVEIYKYDAGEYRWRLRDTNGAIIADSAEGYTRESSVNQAILNVKDGAASAVIEDLT